MSNQNEVLDKLIKWFLNEPDNENRVLKIERFAGKTEVSHFGEIRKGDKNV